MGRSSISKRRKGKTKAQAKAEREAKKKAKAEGKGTSNSAPRGRASDAEDPKNTSKKQRSTTTTMKENVAKRARRSNDGAPAVLDEDGSLSLASDILLTLERDIWWRTFEDDDVGIDVSAGSRQAWHLIIPIYIKAGLYKAPPIDLHKLKFVEKRWDELCLFIQQKHNVIVEWSPMD